MRLLFWSDSFWPRIGGAEVLGQGLVATLRARGHTLAVVTQPDAPGQAAEAQENGIPIYRFPFSEVLAAGRAPARAALQGVAAVRGRVARLKQEFKPDVIHVHFMGPGMFFHLGTLGAWRAPWAVALHNVPAEAMLGPEALFGRALRAAHWVTACSDYVLAEACRRAPELAGRASAVYNALAMPALAPQPLPLNPPRLLCLGRLIPEKGFDLALAALPALLARFPGLRLTVAGEGPARADLERRAAEMGLGAAVEFTGAVPPQDVPALLNAAAVVLVPSRWQEPFGLVALQAAQMARPVVAAHAGGLPEVVADGETGLLFEREDVGGLAQAVAALLADPALAARLGQAGRRRAQSAFSWAAYVDAHERLFDRLVRQSG